MSTWLKITLRMIIIICVAVGYKYYTDKQNELEKAKIFNEQQINDVEALKQELKINQTQAKFLSDELKKAQENKIQPITHITVQAPNVDTAVDAVTDKINNKDTSLPQEILEKTDRIVVAPQPQNKDYPIGVYKINLEKQHQIKAGATVLNNKPYWSIGYQQNKMEIILHGQHKIDGVTAIYTIKKW